MKCKVNSNRYFASKLKILNPQKRNSLSKICFSSIFGLENVTSCPTKASISNSLARDLIWRSSVTVTISVELSNGTWSGVLIASMSLVFGKIASRLHFDREAIHWPTKWRPLRLDCFLVHIEKATYSASSRRRTWTRWKWCHWFAMKKKSNGLIPRLTWVKY